MAVTPPRNTRNPRGLDDVKLIIQIPCFNEAESLPITLPTLPRAVAGCDTVEWMVIDDGSTDGTADVARAHGVDHVVRHAVNRGLATTFMTGLNACIERGADIIVNTDADNQYDARDIDTLVQQILAGNAEFVVGARPIASTEHFSAVKKLLQALGSAVVRIASGTRVMDAPSGFRALTRDVAMRLNVFDSYTYTLETLIQAGRSNIRVVSIPIRTNPDLRPSRLMKSMGGYVFRSLWTIVRIFATYRPMMFFWLLSAGFGIVGFGTGLRYMILRWQGDGSGHIQSLILMAACITACLSLFMLGFLADLMATNRRLLEKLDWRLRKLESSTPRAPSAPTKD